MESNNLDRVCDDLDACVFTGDALAISQYDRDEFRKYLDRWRRELDKEEIHITAKTGIPDPIPNGAKSELHGHLIVWQTEKDRWVYIDNGKPIPATGGETRSCVKCGELMSLGDVDPCLGELPGVDNACCGHGNPEQAYIRFTNGLAVLGFTIDEGSKP